MSTQLRSSCVVLKSDKVQQGTAHGNAKFMARVSGMEVPECQWLPHSAMYDPAIQFFNSPKGELPLLQTP